MYVLVVFHVRGVQPDARMFERVRPTDSVAAKDDLVADDTSTGESADLDTAERVHLMPRRHQPHTRLRLGRQEDRVLGGHGSMMRATSDTQRRPTPSMLFFMSQPARNTDVADGAVVFALGLVVAVFFGHWVAVAIGVVVMAWGAVMMLRAALNRPMPSRGDDRG